MVEAVPPHRSRTRVPAMSAVKSNLFDTGKFLGSSHAKVNEKITANLVKGFLWLYPKHLERV
jgi:hypothetical protein